MSLDRFKFYNVKLDDNFVRSSEDTIRNYEINISVSRWVEHAFRMFNKDKNKYENFSFKGREYWVPIYDSAADKIIAKCGRQVNKSTWLGNYSLSLCCIQPAFKTLYVSPSQTQTKEYMKDRVIGPIEDSEVLKKYKDTKGIDNTLVKQFITRSEILFRYAFLNADRIRGIGGVDLLIIDEVQNIIKDNIPIIEQVQFAASAKYKKTYYSGTPLGLDNPIEDIWANQSTQNEWAIPCHRHSYLGGGKLTRQHWNIITDEKCIGKEGLICDSCGNPITPRDPLSTWVAMNPNVAKTVAEPFHGYHIPQLISPDCKWSRVLHYMNTYGKAQFYNEVLGISFDSGEKPISRQDLIDNCVYDKELPTRSE